jgi:hypothetical protein
MQDASKKWQNENPLRTRYLTAKSLALSENRRQSRAFELTMDQCSDLWAMGCHYCQRDISNNKGVGLDRKDNSRGYTLDNVLPCCGDCNKVRNTVLSVEEMEIVMAVVSEIRKTKSTCLVQWNEKIAEPDEYVRRICLRDKGHDGEHSMERDDAPVST